LIIREFYCLYLQKHAKRDLENKKHLKKFLISFQIRYLNNASETEKIDLMFRFIQYIERQIVLFDAIEDAAFPAVNNMEGRGSLRDIKEKTDAKEKTRN
jgi:phosphoenolpyruvate carboxylase